MNAPQKTVSVEEVLNFAKFIHLDSIAPGRYSTLLAFELYCHAFIPQTDRSPAKIVEEIRILEGFNTTTGTKPADQFAHPPLQGLWKKHFLNSGRQALVTNVSLALNDKGRTEVVRRHLGKV